MRIFLIVGFIIIAILLPVASAEIRYTITPENPVIGDTVTIVGTGALPDDFVYPSITFETEVSVDNSIYEYEISRIYIPPENYNFELTASPVDELSIYAKPAWLPLGLTYNGVIHANKGSISYGHIIIPTNYDLKIYGKAHNNNKVKLEIRNTAREQTDSTGGFRIESQTNGLPSGIYSVDISGRKKKIELRSPTSTSTLGTSGKIQTNVIIPSEEPQISETTPEISNEGSLTSEATPEITTTSEEIAADKPVNSGAVPEQKPILQKILDFLKFWK